MKKVLKNKNGFTLLEIILGIALSLIIMGAVISAFVLGANSNNAANEAYASKSIATMIVERVKNEVRYADTVTIYSDDASAPKTDGVYCIYQQNGAFYERNGSSGVYSILPGQLENGFSCALLFTKTSDRSIGLEVRIMKNGNELYKTQTAVYINNLISSSVGGTQGSSIAFTKIY